MATTDKALKDKEKSTTYADKRRQEKKQSLREFISAQQYLHAINRDLDRFIDEGELATVKFKTETRLKLLNKILPDLKAIEHTGDSENPVQVNASLKVTFD